MSTVHTPPVFPDFVNLNIKHLSFINAFTSAFDPYSDFNFTSLFCWGDGHAQVSLLNDNLVLRMPGYMSKKINYSILGTSMIDESLLMLLGHTSKLEFVPEITVQSIKDNSVFAITEDRENFDYIYQNSALSNLQGSNLKKIRNKVNTFEAAHKNMQVKSYTIASFSNAITTEIKKINTLWEATTKRADGKLASERNALYNLLDHSSELNLLLTCILVDGSLKGFSINEIIDEKYAICHFEKALKDHHVNVYSYLAREVATALFSRGIPLVNWEQDLGLAGLRHSKRSYSPYTMLKKYTVRQRPSQL